MLLLQCVSEVFKRLYVNLRILERRLTQMLHLNLRFYILYSSQKNLLFNELTLTKVKAITREWQIWFSRVCISTWYSITFNQIKPFLISVFSTRSNVSEKSYSSLSTGGGASIINRVNNQDTEYYGVPFNIRNR